MVPSQIHMSEFSFLSEGATAERTQNLDRHQFKLYLKNQLGDNLENYYMTMSLYFHILK